MPLQIRRGTEAERLALTSVNGLVVGELLYTTDDQKLYVGNGVTPGGVPATSYNNNDAKAAAGEALSSGTHKSISFSYDSVTRTINSNLDLSDYQGTIKANSFKGSILTDDGSSLGGITLVDSTDGRINLDGTVKGNVIPDINQGYDIGSNLLRFNRLYLSQAGVQIGDAVISESGGVINLPAGTTIGGVEVGLPDGDLNVNIIGDDSTVLVDVGASRINLSGTVKGHIVPATTLAYDLGSPSFRFRDLYLSGSSLYLGDARITANFDGTVNLPLGSTVGGIDIASIASEGVINADIVADDSTTLVSASLRAAQFPGGITGDLLGNVLGIHYGNVEGNLEGNVTGNVNGNVTGDLTGNVTGDVFASDGTTKILESGNGTTIPAVLTGNVTGDVTGNLTGNVFGDVTGTVFGNLQGTVTGNLNGDVVGDLFGSVFGDDSTLLIDSTESKIVGPIENVLITNERIVGKTINLSGTNDLGEKAGIRIDTDGNSDDTYDLFTINGAKEDNNSMAFNFSRSRGTLASPQPLQAGDEILTMIWFGADADSNPQPAAGILGGVWDTPTSGVTPGFISLATANSSGVITPAVTIDSDQVVDFAANTVTAGGGSGQANISSVAAYLKIKIGGVEYAIPAYSINP